MQMQKYPAVVRFKLYWKWRRKESAGAADPQIVWSGKTLVRGTILRESFPSIARVSKFHLKNWQDKLKSNIASASAQVKSPAVAEYDSDSADLGNAFANMSTIQTKRNDEFGFKENVAECTTGKIVSEETTS